MRTLRLPATRGQQVLVGGAALLVIAIVALVAVRATSGADPDDRAEGGDGQSSATRADGSSTSSVGTTTTVPPSITATTARLPPITVTAPPVDQTTAAPRTSGPPAATAPATTAPPATDAPAARGREYPRHTSIAATTFWVGELYDESIDDGSQVCSTYDSAWAYHWSGIDEGRVPDDAAGCAGSIVGGCDGVRSGDECQTETRTAGNDYFPTQATPRENPFYLDLPYDDLNDEVGFSSRCSVIPWAGDPGFAGRCGDRSFSMMKNRWVRMTGPNGRTCYGQVQDAGPSHDDLYHDAAYVFGADDRRPAQKQFNNAGLDVSPALNGCLGFAELDGEDDRVDWQFVDDVDVPAGPWTRVVTTTGVHN